MNASTRTDVLVPLITSRCEEAAIQQAVEDFPLGKITVLAVITPLDEPLAGGVVEVSEKDYRQERATIRSIVDRSMEPAGHFEGNIEIEIEDGMPTDVAVEYVTDHHIDHVVVPESQSSRIVGHLVDSPETSLQRRISVPVTCVDC